MKVVVKVRPDKERGLFSTKAIKKGEMVCIMPIDYIQLDGNWYRYKSGSGEGGGGGGGGGEELLDFRYGIVCEIQKLSSCELDDFTAQYIMVDHTRCSRIFRILMSIKQIIKQHKHSIIGVSNSKKVRGWFIGHMINDYETMMYLAKNKYEQTSNKFSNVTVGAELRLFNNKGVALCGNTPNSEPVITNEQPVKYDLNDTIGSSNTVNSLNSVTSSTLKASNRLGLKITASKNINKGEELYLSYGCDYWKKYSSRGKCIYSVNVSCVG